MTAGGAVPTASPCFHLRTTVLCLPRCAYLHYLGQPCCLS